MECDHLFDSPAFQAALARFAAACDADDVGAQQHAAMQLLKIVEYCGLQSEDFQSSPSMVAARLEETGRWQEAKAVYEQEFARRDPQSNDMTILLHAISPFKLFGDVQRAIALCREGQAAARQMGMEIVECQFSRALGGLLLSVGQVAEARETVDHCIQRAENDNVDVRGRADALILRAQCLLTEGSLDDAQRDLDEAWQQLSKYDTCLFMFGLQTAIGSYWSTLAQLQRANSDLPAAIESMRRAVAKRQAVAASPLDFPTWPSIQWARDLRLLAADLNQAGHRFQAWRAGWRSRRILARYRLDAEGRIPSSRLSRFTVFVIRIIDGPMTWFSRGSIQGTHRDSPNS